MSKALAVNDVVAARVSIATLDGLSSVVLDQAAISDTIEVTTSAATRGILVQSGPDSVHVRSGEIALIAATEVSSVAPLSSIASTDGASSFVIDQAAVTDTIVFATNATAKGILAQAGSASDSVHVHGGDVTLIANSGNFVASAGQVVLSGSSVLQTVLTLDNAATLLGAALSYAVLDSAVIPAITVCSRINIAPGVGGTLLQSIYAGAPSGRSIEFQNIGTGILTFVNQSGLGTGVLIRGPGDYVVPPGGGVVTMFDGGQNFWFVRGI